MTFGMSAAYKLQNTAVVLLVCLTLRAGVAKAQSWSYSYYNSDGLVDQDQGNDNEANLESDFLNI